MARVRIWTLVAIGCAAAIAALATPVSVHPRSVRFGIWAWQLVLMVPVLAIGLAALTMRPAHATARWLAAAGSWIAIATAASRTVQVLAVDAAPSWLLAADLLQVFTMLAAVASLASVLIAFPDAGYTQPWQRPAIFAVWGVPLLVTLGWAFAQPSVIVGPLPTPMGSVANPLAVGQLAPLAEPLALIVDSRSWLWLIGGVALARRWRNSSATVRAQLKWPLMAAVLFLLLAGFLVFLQQLGLVDPELRRLPQFNGWVPGVTLAAASVLAALLRHRLLEVDLWLRRSILFGGLSVAIASAYLVLAGAIGVATGQRASAGIAVVVTLAAVALFEPARRRVEEASRRWVFGTPVTGDEMLRRVGVVLEDANDAAGVSTTLATTIVEGLDLQWVRVSLHVEQTGPSLPVAEAGSPPPDAQPDVVVPLTHAGTEIGLIECGPKRTGEISPSDEQLLATVAGQAGLAVANAGLTAQLESQLDELHRQADELAASRGRIVQAQDMERRRIERDIHDGIQQDIVASIARIRLARNQLEREPRLAIQTLIDLQHHTAQSLERLREVTRGIHPLALTHHGLVAAVEAESIRLPLTVSIKADDAVTHDRFAEEIEAAAYFVIREGLTNVIKHAGTDTATVELRVEGPVLVVAVVDNGAGSNGVRGRGSGITGLTDRVESLGGRLRLDTATGTGTTLHARLPARRIATSDV